MFNNISHGTFTMIHNICNGIQRYEICLTISHGRFAMRDNICNDNQRHKIYQTISPGSFAMADNIYKDGWTHKPGLTHLSLVCSSWPSVVLSVCIINSYSTLLN